MATPKKTIHDIKLPNRKTSKSSSVRQIKSKVEETKKPAARKKVTEEISAPSRVGSDRARVRVVQKPVESEFKTANHSGGHRGKKWFLIITVLAVILAGGYVYGKLFHSAKLLIIPKHSSVDANNAAVVLAKEPTPAEVPLVIMSLSDTSKRIVRSTGTEEVSERASGTIIVYNNFSATPQKLLEETRFQAPDGKIYKTAKGNPLTIPGITNGKPGQIEAVVYAAEPGEEYNKDLTDFTIPGFKGSLKYDKLYARSKTPITGGFVGSRSSISQDEKDRVATELGSDLSDRLKAEANLQKTDAFIILSQSSKVTIGAPVITPAADNPLQAELSITGTYSAILVNKDELAQRLASRLLSGYQGEPISIKNIEDLSFAVVIPEGQDIQVVDNIMLTVSGMPLFVFKVAEEQLKQQLIGIDRKEVHDVLANYPSIDSARFIIKPFWRMKAPADTASLKIHYNLD